MAALKRISNDDTYVIGGMHMRGFIAFLLMLSLLFSAAMAEDISGEMPDIQARGAVLIERTSGRVLYDKNMDELLPVASTTKVMTALLAIENSSMDEVVTTSKRASGVQGTSIYLSVGEQLSMRNMLYGLMLKSGNDAAVAIAEHVGGSVEAFAKMMNERALELVTTAYFVTPNGLDQGGNGASALGLAKITAKALEYADFREIVGTQKATIPWPGNPYDRVLENKNRLLRDLPGATGVKTGFTSKAGRCLVFSCERSGMELIGVVLNCGTWFESAAELIEWGFTNYQPRPLFQKDDVALSAKVSGGIDRRVDALYADSLTLPCATYERPMVLVEMNAPLKAPIEEGQLIGHALVTINGKTECTVPLVAANGVAQGNFWSAFGKAFRCWGIWFTGRS